jgi:hypothetical protein
MLASSAASDSIQPASASVVTAPPAFGTRITRDTCLPRLFSFRLIQYTNSSSTIGSDGPSGSTART